MDVDAASECDAVEDGDDAGKAGSGDDRVLLLLSSALHDEASLALVVVACCSLGSINLSRDPNRGRGHVYMTSNNQ